MSDRSRRFKHEELVLEIAELRTLLAQAADVGNLESRTADALFNQLIQRLALWLAADATRH